MSNGLIWRWEAKAWMSKEQADDGRLAQTRWQKLDELSLENQPGCEQQALMHLHKVLSPLQLPHPLFQKAARNVYNTVNRAHAAQRSQTLLIRYWVAHSADPVSERSWGFFLIERSLVEQSTAASSVYCIELYCYQDVLA
jgi:hypothetical protein